MRRDRSRSGRRGSPRARRSRTTAPWSKSGRRPCRRCRLDERAVVVDEVLLEEVAEARGSSVARDRVERAVRADERRRRARAAARTRCRRTCPPGTPRGRSAASRVGSWPAHQASIDARSSAIFVRAGRERVGAVGGQTQIAWTWAPVDDVGPVDRRLAASRTSRRRTRPARSPERTRPTTRRTRSLRTRAACRSRNRCSVPARRRRRLPRCR